MDFFLPNRLNIEIIRRAQEALIYREQNGRRSSKFLDSRGNNLLDCPGRKKLLDSGISVDYSLFHYSIEGGSYREYSLLRKDLSRINVSGGSSITGRRNCYIFIYFVEEKCYFYFFLFYLVLDNCSTVLSTVNQVKHRGTRDVDVSKAVALHLQTQSQVSHISVFSL